MMAQSFQCKKALAVTASIFSDEGLFRIAILDEPPSENVKGVTRIKQAEIGPALIENETRATTIYTNQTKIVQSTHWHS